MRDIDHIFGHIRPKAQALLFSEIYSFAERKVHSEICRMKLTKKLYSGSIHIRAYQKASYCGRQQYLAYYFAFVTLFSMIFLVRKLLIKL